MTRMIDIVFDGPPGPEAGRFVEVENESGASIGFGEWVERDDGFWALRIPDYNKLFAENIRLKGLIADAKARFDDIVSASEGQDYEN